jgi:hypothetical protein
VRVTITVPERAAGIADALFSLTLISSIRIARPYDCRTSAVSGCHACLRAHGFLMLLSVAVRFPAGGGSFTLKERCAHDARSQDAGPWAIAPAEDERTRP